MKILYVCRLYSGFEESLQNGVWSPKGAPTIARMIEHLDGSDAHYLRVVFTQKGASDARYSSSVSLDGLSKPVTVLAGMMHLPAWLWKFREKLSDALQLFQIIKIYRQEKPDFVYCDRVNILPAAVLSRFMGAKVVWRVMGVLEHMHAASTASSIRAKISKWLWRSPFRAVICTLDGSGGGPWMTRVLREGVASHLLINGVHKTQDLDDSAALPNDGVKMLFVGRLESLKGIQEFMAAFYRVAAAHPRLHAVIAGDGSLTQELRQEAEDMGLSDRVHFLGSITPKQLKYIRGACDFYVSLNKQGNLSNVNLEALSDYLPTIVPVSHDPVDVDTDRMIPADVFLRFGVVGDARALSDAIEIMMDDAARARFSDAAKACADRVLPSWDKRVAQEMEIYEQV